MTEDRERLLELLREAERIADRLKEGIAAYQIQMAIMELKRPGSTSRPS
jgi:hypothetical protein